MAQPTRGTALASAASTATPTVANVVVAAGSGRGILTVLAYRRATTESVTSVPTRDGQASTLIGTVDVATNYGVRVYELLNANEGTASMVAGLSATRDSYMVCVPYTDLSDTDPFNTPVLANALAAAVAGVTADDEVLSIPAVYFSTANSQSFTPTSPVSELSGTDVRSNSIYGAAGVRTGTGEVTSEWGFGATPTAVYTVAVRVSGVVSGPIITEQPVAAAGLLAGDPARRTTTYHTAFTGVGLTEEGVVWFQGATPIEDGGIYAVATVIAPDGLSGESTLEITRTATTGSPFSIKANVEDDNGDVDSSVVADTWYAGPSRAPASETADGSGEAAFGATSDFPNTAAGEVTVYPMTVGSVAKYLALRYQAP